MSYLEVKKRIMKNKGNTELEARTNHTKWHIANNFHNDPSYKSAILIKPQMTNRSNSDNQIDVRVVNTDKANIKKFYLKPDTVIAGGSYIELEKFGTYLITDFEWNLLSPCAIGTKCNQIIRINGFDFLFAIISGESYGVKLTNSTEFYSDSDTKVKALVQKNELSRNIPLGFRFMVDKSKEGIYKLGDMAVYNDGYYAFTCAKDNFMDGDDLENGICFNGEMKPEEPTEVKLNGENDIVINKEYTYTVSPSDNYSFKLEEYATNNNIATIVNSTVNSVTIKAIKPDEVFELIVLKDNKQVASKTIMSVRR